MTSQSSKQLHIIRATEISQWQNLTFCQFVISTCLRTPFTKVKSDVICIAPNHHNWNNRGNGVGTRRGAHLSTPYPAMLACCSCHSGPSRDKKMDVDLTFPATHTAPSRCSQHVLVLGQLHSGERSHCRTGDVVCTHSFPCKSVLFVCVIELNFFQIFVLNVMSDFTPWFISHCCQRPWHSVFESNLFLWSRPCRYPTTPGSDSEVPAVSPQKAIVLFSSSLVRLCYANSVTSFCCYFTDTGHFLALKISFSPEKRIWADS